jgi:hypothetical protein
MDIIDYYVATILKARKMIEKLVIAIKDYDNNVANFMYEFDYPNKEQKKIRFNRVLFGKYMKYAKEIPDDIVYSKLIEFKDNIEYRMQNIFIILLKNYKELVYLYKACDLSKELKANNREISYEFINPFKKFGVNILNKTYGVDDLILLNNLKIELVDFMSNELYDAYNQYIMKNNQYISTTDNEYISKDNQYIKDDKNIKIEINKMVNK